MKIVAGKFKGKKLIERPLSHVRPTADMVKQSIFNKLQFEILDSKVLDLFCGTGALGIEAISRGASEVVFADCDKQSIALTKDNLQSIGSPAQARVMLNDFKQALSALQGEKFNVILLDPPYKSGIYEECLNLIHQKQVLADDGIIVCEQDKNIKIDYQPFVVEDQRCYGIKMVTYLKLY